MAEWQLQNHIPCEWQITRLEWCDCLQILYWRSHLHVPRSQVQIHDAELYDLKLKVLQLTMYLKGILALGFKIQSDKCSLTGNITV